MVAGLVDSTVIVDILREYPPAQIWSSRQLDLGVTQIVWLEVLQGSPNKQSQIKATKLLKAHEQVSLEAADFEWAIRTALIYTLSHNVSAFDCLIAASSARLNVPLYTSNIKHFVPLLGELAQNPY